MKRLDSTLVALGALVLAGCGHATAPSAAASPTAQAGASRATGQLEVFRSGSRPPTTGAPAHFTGRAVITPLYSALPPTHGMAASVSFDPGARTAWHTHPAGQKLIITAGTGWVQSWGGKKLEVHPGDVVWIPPGAKHWHGATTTSGMTHIAIQEPVGGSVVDWKEHVSDAQYRR